MPLSASGLDLGGDLVLGHRCHACSFERRRDGQQPIKRCAYRGNFYVRNALNRYGILSTMPLKFNADGSLDVYVQADSPGASKESNWLPIPPSGMFNLTTRVYQPKQEMLDGSYKLPPVMKVQ